MIFVNSAEFLSTILTMAILALGENFITSGKTQSGK